MGRSPIRIPLMGLIAAVTLGQLLVQKTAAQTAPDPAYATLTEAYSAVQARGYDAAIELFRKAAVLAPGRADIHKNLAYTLLKTGENEAAREEFGEAMRIEPADDHVALEYAFLCYEARENAAARKAEARRIFDRVRNTGSGETRATAEQAFRNVDGPLKSGIARWKEVLAGGTPTFSAYHELAELAEQRDELDLAAGSYRAAFRLQSGRKSVLLEVARVEKARGDGESAMAAWLAASRGGEPRAAEMAREQMPGRYPYVYEFRAALELDPTSEELHRELAYLLLSMSERGAATRVEAEQEFRVIVESTPEDYLAMAQLGLLLLADGEDGRAMPYLQKVLEKGDAATANRVRMALKIPLVLEERLPAIEPLDPRILGERSYAAGFLKDAKKYFLQAHEQNPVDGSVMLKLGWTNNMLHDDEAAVRWFRLAQAPSADPKVSGEAAKAYESLRPEAEAFRTTLWVAPAYSSRWNDLFGYGQVKTEFKVKSPLLRPYVTTRLVGDARVETGVGELGHRHCRRGGAFIFGVGAWRRGSGAGQWRGGRRAWRWAICMACGRRITAGDFLCAHLWGVTRSEPWRMVCRDAGGQRVCKPVQRRSAELFAEQDWHHGGIGERESAGVLGCQYYVRPEAGVLGKFRGDGPGSEVPSATDAGRDDGDGEFPARGLHGEYGESAGAEL